MDTKKPSIFTPISNRRTGPRYLTAMSYFAALLMLILVASKLYRPLIPAAVPAFGYHLMTALEAIAAICFLSRRPRVGAALLVVIGIAGIVAYHVLGDKSHCGCAGAMVRLSATGHRLLSSGLGLYGLTVMVLFHLKTPAGGLAEAD